MRVGVFGGSFDPVHYGHLLLAESCREQADLDEVRFVPATVSPYKIGSSPVSAEARVDMLELAIGGHRAFTVCDIEIKRGGVSYTVDTLQALQDEDVSRELFFLMGADSLVDFPEWRQPASICELATLLVVSRPGAPPPDFESLKSLVPTEQLNQIRDSLVTMPQIGISSTDMRERVSQGRSIRFQTPRAVQKYIETNKLYALD